MPRADQADRRSGLRPVKCGAKSKQSGEQCRRWAVVGTVPPRCTIHGAGKGAVKDKADLRVVAAQLGVLGLEPAETIRVIQRVLSEQMLRASGALAAAAEEGRPVEPLEHQRFVDATDRALVAARVALSSGVSEALGQREEDREEDAELMAKAVTWAVDGVLGLVQVDAEWRTQLRTYALEMASWAFAGAQTGRPVPPKVPVSYGPQSYVVAAGELLPAPVSRQRAVDVDEIWRAASEITDAEIVDEEGDDDDDNGAVAG